MAVKMKVDSDVPESTGNVTFDDSVQVITLGTDPAAEGDGIPKSTGNVSLPEVVEVVAPWHGSDAVVNVATPGPVTMTVSWAPETKVLGPVGEPPSVDPSPVVETK